MMHAIHIIQNFRQLTVIPLVLCVLRDHAQSWIGPEFTPEKMTMTASTTVWSKKECMRPYLHFFPEVINANTLAI
jgi:hypothetical protein